MGHIQSAWSHTAEATSKGEVNTYCQASVNEVKIALEYLLNYILRRLDSSLVWP